VELAVADLPAHTHGSSLTVSGTNAPSNVTGTAGTSGNAALTNHSHSLSGATSQNDTATLESHVHAFSNPVLRRTAGSQDLQLTSGSYSFGVDSQTEPSNIDHTHPNAGAASSVNIDHTHPISGVAEAQAWTGTVGGSTSSIGGGGSHLNVQPTIVMNYIIRAI
jgi:hypothetical protein